MDKKTKITIIVISFTLALIYVVGSYITANTDENTTSQQLVSQDTNTEPDTVPIGTILVLNKTVEEQDWFNHHGEFNVVTYRVLNVEEPWKSYSRCPIPEGIVRKTTGDLTTYYNVDTNKTYKVELHNIYDPTYGGINVLSEVNRT
jgi:hypothetical protein